MHTSRKRQNIKKFTKIYKNTEKCDENKLITNAEFYDPMAIRWLEKYGHILEKFWVKVPDFCQSILVTLMIFVFGATINGEWLLIIIHSMKHLGCMNYLSSNKTFDLYNLSLEDFRLQNLPEFWFSSIVVSYVIYYIVGGFLQWYFYVRRRDQAHEWKCQPEKWLSPELERHEIIVGSCSLLVVSSFTSMLACYIYNGGYSLVYYDFAEYGWLWFWLQWPVIFIYQDYAAYWLHRIYHYPFLYKHFHKLHHKYKQPTAFSATAIHPIEILHIQVVLCLPLFIIPCNWVAFYVIALYSYYHGLIDHSGINFKAQWWQPWQPDAIFHDNHHQYFHVNFGFNIYLWDKIHGTYRRKDRVYTEDTFYGVGKTLKEATVAELKKDMKERLSENPFAYHNNVNENILTEEELKKCGKSINNDNLQCTPGNCK